MFFMLEGKLAVVPIIISLCMLQSTLCCRFLRTNAYSTVMNRFKTFIVQFFLYKYRQRNPATDNFVRTRNYNFFLQKQKQSPAIFDGV